MSRTGTSREESTVLRTTQPLANPAKKYPTRLTSSPRATSKILSENELAKIAASGFLASRFSASSLLVLCWFSAGSLLVLCWFSAGSLLVL
jgi:hypothetical protein